MFLAEWWNSLSLALQIFYCIAIPASLVLLVQTILMFLGFDEGADGDVEVDISEPDATDGVFGDNSLEGWEPSSDFGSLHIFTFRGIVAFFVIFGWVGVVMQSFEINLPITIIVATVCGFAMMIGIAFLLKLVMRLRNSGTTDNRNAIGAAGKVYLTIPPSRSGEGKVNIMLQGAYVERNAVTDETESIPTGCEIIVVGISGETSLVVKRK